MRSILQSPGICLLILLFNSSKSSTDELDGIMTIPTLSNILSYIFSEILSLKIN